MRNYYTRACNFYHGRVAKNLMQSKKALSLNGKRDLAFDNIEIFTRDKGRVRSNLIHFKDINKLKKNIKKIVQQDIKKITSKRKNFLKPKNAGSCASGNRVTMPELPNPFEALAKLKDPMRSVMNLAQEKIEQFIDNHQYPDMIMKG